MRTERKLQDLGLKLPRIAPPLAQYLPFVQVDNLLFLAGTTGEWGDRKPIKGKVGKDITVKEAYEAAKECGLAHLAAMKLAVGDLDNIERIVRLIGYVNGAPGFGEAPWVLNGESDLYIALWGEKGRHARAALNVPDLVYDFSVETEVIVQVKVGLRRPRQTAKLQRNKARRRG